MNARDAISTSQFADVGIRVGGAGANVDRLYLRNKKDYQAQYGHPLIEEILEETYGCIIFQEQVMELANKVAGIW